MYFVYTTATKKKFESFSTVATKVSFESISLINRFDNNYNFLSVFDNKEDALKFMEKDHAKGLEGNWVYDYRLFEGKELPVITKVDTKTEEKTVSYTTTTVTYHVEEEE